MTTKQRVVFISLLIVSWIILAVIFSHLNYEYAVLDSITILFGFIIPILTMLAYIEYTYLWIVQAVLGVFLNIQMMLNDFTQTTYFIYGIYALYCVICAFLNVQKFYKEQQIIKERAVYG